MKKQIIYSAFCLGLMALSTSVMAQTQPARIIVRKTTQVAPAVQQLNLESTFRCDVRDYGDIDVASTISLRPQDFTLKQKNNSDVLPRFEVNGFSFGTMPIDEALQLLVKEADIIVYTEDNFYPEMTASDLYGELEPVIQELSHAGDIYYRYDADDKALTLSKQAEFELQLPRNRAVVLAALDALRGAGIKTAVVNWKNYSVEMSLSHEEEELVSSLMADIVKNGYFVLADTRVYLLSPMGKDGWQNVVTDFGVHRVYKAKGNKSGKVLAMEHQHHDTDLATFLPAGFNPRLISQGMAIVPDDWKMRFDVGRCAVDKKYVSPLSMVLNATVQKPQEIKTLITFDSVQGDVASFDIWTAMDEQLAIVGIPASSLNMSDKGELFVTLKFRLIRLVKEK